MRNTAFIDLGRKGYREVWQQQEELLAKTQTEKLQGTGTHNYLLFVEHPHVYTLGRSGDEANMLMNAIQLQACRADFIKVDRGGDITYHGPGQLVGYPVIDMENFGLGVKEYVNNLEEVIIRSIADFGIVGKRMEGATGVWIEPETPRARKICAIGVRCSRFVTMHGFALNANTDLKYFHFINPCGFIDKGVTSIEKEVGRQIEMEQVKEVVRKYFIEIFGMVFDSEN